MFDPDGDNERYSNTDDESDGGLHEGKIPAMSLMPASYWYKSINAHPVTRWHRQMPNWRPPVHVVI